MIKDQKKIVIVLAGLVVLVLAGYYLISTKKQLATESPVANTVVGTDKNSASESTVTQASSSSVFTVSGIKLSIPSTWTTKKESDSKVTISIPGIKSSATLAVAKCPVTGDLNGDFACFGSGRNNYREIANGGIYDLLSESNVYRFGLDLGVNNNNSSYLYDISFDFGDYQPSQKESDMVYDVVASAALP